MKTAALKQKLPPILMGLVLTLVFSWTQTQEVPLVEGIKQRMEFLIYDLRLNSSLKLTPQQSEDKGVDRVVIIDIDEKSLGQEGRWPWTRAKIADLTDKLFEAGVVVIGYDIFFSEPERNNALSVLHQIEASGEHSELTETLKALAPEFDNDNRLAQSLQGNDTVLGYLFHEEETPPTGELPAALVQLSPEAAARSGIKAMANYTAGLPLLQSAAADSGFVTSWPDADGIIRRTPMVARYQDKIYGSLSLTVAKLYLFLEEVEVATQPIGDYDAVEKIILGQTEIPSNGYGFTLVPYRGPGGSFPYISATDVLSGNIDPAELEGAIVLIGASAVGIADLVATPVENIYPGVEVHANMVRAILDDRFYTEPSWAMGANLTTTLLVGLLLALLLPYLSPASLLGVSLLTAAGLTAGNFWLWHENGLALALAWPLLLIVLLSSLNMTYGFLSEYRKRSHLKTVFGQYIPPQLVERMSDDDDGFGFEGESREMTVLFADIRGFTTLSEKLSPAELRQLLNRYFTHMTEIIFDHNGTIDKYVGDMIMAFWGAPLRTPNHAGEAIAAALAMLQKTEELKPQLIKEGYPEINIGIGLNTGLMNVGDMGSRYRRAYTVLGDNVNLGSRIEGLTKFYGVGLVVGEATQATCEDYIYRRLDLVKVKGKTEGVNVYQPICPAGDADATLIAELERHEEGLNAYRAQQWDSADAIFHQLLNQHPQTRVYSLYLERIAELRQRDLGADWNGVYERREK